MDHMPSPEKVDLVTLKQILIDTDGENFQEQSGELRGYAATQVGDSIRELV
jgi:hypothetical protein